MLPNLSEIKQLRKKLGLTQAELAKRASVSQSLIAKVEAGRLQPGYAVVSKLFSALEEAGRGSERTAQQLMNRKVVCVSCADKLKAAVAKMRAHEFSQLPVMEAGRVVGMVSETSILDSLFSGKGAQSVREVMEEAPPIVSQGTPARMVALMLKHCPMVLVADGGKIEGIITRADLLAGAGEALR